MRAPGSPRSRTPRKRAMPCRGGAFGSHTVSPHRCWTSCGARSSTPGPRRTGLPIRTGESRSPRGAAGEGRCSAGSGRGGGPGAVLPDACVRGGEVGAAPRHDRWGGPRGGRLLPQRPGVPPSGRGHTHRCLVLSLRRGGRAPARTCSWCSWSPAPTCTCAWGTRSWSWRRRRRCSSTCATCWSWCSRGTS